MPPYASEVNFPDFIQYYITLQCGDYQNAGTYDEKCPSSQEGFALLYPDPIFSLDAGRDVYHTSIPSSESTLFEQVYEGGSWLGVCESYFDGSWGEDQLSFYSGFDTFNNMYASELEKAEEAYPGEAQCGGSYYSYDNDVEMHPSYDYNTCRGNEDIHDDGRIKSVHGYNWDDMKLCESIFGYWPCLLKQNQESCDD